MRIIDVAQRTEEWERLRARPTASEFSSFITPVKGDYSKQATKYAAKIISKRLGTYVEPPPSFWMEWGTEHEDEAKRAYTAHTGNTVQEVGFVVPNNHDAYGGSPDGLIGADGLLETKCPAPETLLMYHAQKTLPNDYIPQVQGLMMICERKWCDFFAYHPEIKPFLIRVKADLKYQAKIADGLLRLLDEVEEIERAIA